MAWPIISSDSAIQMAYEECRSRGESHGIAEILATRQCPGVVTDTGFFHTEADGKQWGRNSDQLKYRKLYESLARRAGVNTTGKSYVPGLARFPGDPKAWVSTVTARSEIKRQCQERGLACSGSVNVKGHSVDVDPMESAPLVDPKIVENEVTVALALEPGKASKINDLQNQVIDRLAPPWRKRTDAAIRASKKRRTRSRAG